MSDDFTPSDTASFVIETVDWATHHQDLYDIRYRVFVLEQQVPVELEQDDYDPISRHVLARTVAGETIGTGRLLPDGHIGRVAVLPQWRNHGIGRLLMMHLINEAHKLGFRVARLNAQVAVLDFYAKLGFCAEGDIFMDAGIPHRSMYRVLSS